MAYTTAADLTNGQIAMVGTARFVYEHRAVMTNLCARMVLGAGDKSQYIPKFGTVTAKDLTDGVHMTEAQSLSITGTTHTTDEAGCKVIITKKLRNQLKEDAYIAAGKIVGNMMGRKIDNDGVALFSGLSNSLGAASTTLTLGLIAAGVSQMKGQSEPVPEPYVAVFHPHSLNALVDLIATPAANTAAFPSDLSLPLLRDYWRGTEKLYGEPIFGDGNITAGSAAFCALFAPETVIYLVGG